MIEMSIDFFDYVLLVCVNGYVCMRVCMCVCDLVSCVCVWGKGGLSMLFDWLYVASVEIDPLDRFRPFSQG